MQRPTYFADLDALRFIAFLFIFLGHALDTPNADLSSTSFYQSYRTHIYTLGKTGFSFAFVLSSYINTWVILAEREGAKGRFSPWRFYLRRALRIWPLYFVVLFIGFTLVPYVAALAGSGYTEQAHPLWFALFAGNFYLIEHGFTHSPIISVLWSVSVEEQFYIVWPFLLILFRWHMRLLVPLLIGVFLLITYRFQATEVNLFFHTLFLLGDIAIGALFAHWSFHGGAVFNRLVALPRWAIGSVYAAFVLSLVFYQPLFNGHIVPEPFSLMIEKLWFATLLGFIIFEQNFCGNSVLKFRSVRAFTYFGVISYGLFCFHEIGLLVGQRLIDALGHGSDLSWTLGAKPLIAFLLIWPMAHLSWNSFEKPFLKLKTYLRSN